MFLSRRYLRPLLLAPIFLAVLLLSAGHTSAQTVKPPAGKPPVIIIPGLTGSDLINDRTGKVVWFSPRRAKDDDIRLPISPNLERNRDNLVSRDIIRSIKFFKFLPETEIYERLINALEQRGGYKEGSLNFPPKDGYRDTFYVFPYDWRRDNVENARLLITRIETLKRKLRRPDLKFNIIAHSMGGLIARYAAMYGDADLSGTAPRPTWAGSRHLDKIFLLGTPNEGSILAINALLNGFSYIGGGLNLPFIQNINRFDVFTIPSVYQLLPHDGTLRAYDEDLNPLTLDVYDPAVWEKYDWAVWKDDDFSKKLTPAEQRAARAYFTAVLERAKRFQAAIRANTRPKTPVSIYLIGGDCKETQNAILLARNEKKGRWETRFKAEPYDAASGAKVTAEQLKGLLFALGDGVVTKRSLGAETGSADGRVLPIVESLFQCEGHNKLVTNAVIQDRLLEILGAAPAATGPLPAAGSK